jgi:hypothetical protein
MYADVIFGKVYNDPACRSANQRLPSLVSLKGYRNLLFSGNFVSKFYSQGLRATYKTKKKDLLCFKKYSLDVQNIQCAR